MLRKTNTYPIDYSDLIIGIAKIPSKLGFKWLGTNEFLTVSSLFPAAYFDSGYKILFSTKIVPQGKNQARKCQFY